MLWGWQWRNVDVEVVIFIGRIRMEVFTARMLLLNGYVSRLTRDEDVLCTVALRLLIDHGLHTHTSSSSFSALSSSSSAAAALSSFWSITDCTCTHTHTQVSFTGITVFVHPTFWAAANVPFPFCMEFDATDCCNLVGHDTCRHNCTVERVNRQ